MARVEIEMPKMGESVMEGTVIEWAKEIGDEVEEDETLLEIATDKVDTEVPSPESGILVEKLASEDDTIEVGEIIAIIETDKNADINVDEDSTAEAENGDESEGETAEPVDASVEEDVVDGKGDDEYTEPSESAAEETEEAATEGTGSSAQQEASSKPQRRGSDGRFYSPLVRSIAEEEGISQEELESIEGSGKEGRVAKQDILDYLESREAAPSQQQTEEKPSTSGLSKPAAKTQQQPDTKQKSGISAGELHVSRPSDNVEIVKMDRMRKTIADHMVRSKQTSAHVTTFAEADVTELVQWRNDNKKEFKEHTGQKLTFTPLFIEAIIQAIREYPLINSSVDGDEILVKKDINFGIAVALGQGGTGGLIVPVIKKAQDKSLEGIAKSVNDLAVKARNKNLSPDDLVGGTITLTNYGSVGNLMGTPIINQPQVAIFGTGAIEKRPVVLETKHGDVIAVRRMMFLSLSYDHRIIDGAHGGAFLGRVKELLENFDTDRNV